jgi:hypothetical protein
MNFRFKQNINTGHIGFEPWRENEHDDLVFAAALCVWGANMRRKRMMRDA